MEQITKMFNTIEPADGWIEIYGNRIELTINDFEGFDEDWEEIEHDYVDEKAVNAVLEWLERECDGHNNADMYREYYFGDITIELGFTSYDI